MHRMVYLLNYIDHVLSDEGFQSESEVRRNVFEVTNFLKLMNCVKFIKQADEEDVIRIIKDSICDTHGREDAEGMARAIFNKLKEQI